MNKAVSVAAAYLLAACIGIPVVGVATAQETTAASKYIEFIPPNDGYDWIQLTSGEWLKGEMISLFNEEVLFDSDILDELTIDAEDVLQFISPRTFGISIKSAGLIDGQVWVEPGRVVVTSGEGQQEFRPDDLVAITVATERERERWTADLMFGINAREGNTQFVETNITAGAERRTPVSRVSMDYRANFNETEGQQVANNHRVNLVVDRFSRYRFFWRPLISQYFRDPFQNIAHQGTLETGVGYELMDTRKTEWEIYSAVGVNYVRRESVEVGQSDNSTSPSLSFGTDYETELTSWIDYLFSLKMSLLDEDSGKYQHHLETGVSTDLIGDIDLDVTLVWDRTENPPLSAEGILPKKDDFRLMFGVGFDF